ncbi:hypothetical protein [Pseudomonas poae]|uniref:hypothetical protein n=1 Tax=Pseudomonas poae TaxID=200451 RepID=UPI0009EBC23B|nr:hypothetical protein [Pseudomonas poae]
MSMSPLAFFSREELLDQQCSLLESELALMGEELAASREKIATLVATAVTDQRVLCGSDY